MPENNIGIIIGASLFTFGIFALLAAILIRAGRDGFGKSTGTEPGWNKTKLFRVTIYILMFSIPITFLVNALALVDGLRKGQWFQCLNAAGMIIGAIYAIFILKSIRQAYDRELQSKE